jgi:hypothetical protein
MTQPTQEKDTSNSRVVRTIESLKKHPLVTVLGTLVAVVAGCATIMDMSERMAPVVENVIAPTRAQEEAISSLALEQTVDFVNGKLGQPQQSEDLCRVVPICSSTRTGEPTLNVYRDEHYTVRAVFEANSLEFFSVTLESEIFRPHIKWNGYDLGVLGQVKYAEAYQPVTVNVEPTAVMIFLGPQSSAYTEVVAPGAPGDYQGLILASAPDGNGEVAWDMEGAVALNEAQLASAGKPASLDQAHEFRAGSAPNTFGMFHDDGDHIGNLLHDPQNALTLLYAGTNL